MRFSASTSDYLQLVTGQNGARVTASFGDAVLAGDGISAYQDKAPQVTSVTSATTTTILSTPAANLIRRLDDLIVYNTYAGSHTITVQTNSSATIYTHFTTTLAQNETLCYSRTGGGWYVLTSDGSKKSGFGIVPPQNGGTGIANNVANTVTFTGAFSLGVTLTANTAVTLPTSGTLATLAGVEELDNKTLDSSVGKGTWTASGTWTLPSVTLGGTTTLGALSGTSSGTYTLGGTITLSGSVTGSGTPSMTSMGAWSGTTVTGSGTGSFGSTGANAPVLIGKGASDAYGVIAFNNDTVNVTMVGLTGSTSDTDLYFRVPTSGTYRFRFANADGTTLTATALTVGATGTGTLAVGNTTITGTVSTTGIGGIGAATSSTTNLNLAAGTTGVSSLRVPHGAAPTSPVDGDMWTTTAGLYVRINGVTVGPLS